MTRDSQTDLPAGWERCVLSDFTDIVMGQSPLSETYNSSGQGLPFFQGKSEFGPLYPQIRLYCSQPKKIAYPGATLLSVRAPVGPTNLAMQKCCIGRGLAAIHPRGGIVPKFLLYMFRNIESRIARKGTGSTFNAITKNAVEDIEFDLPPLLEQRRILARIEVLFSELNDGIESIESAHTQLGAYRRAIIELAFAGKLTSQWREENKNRLQTPEQLLAKIKQERLRRDEQRLLKWQTAVREWEDCGRHGRKPRKPKTLPTFIGLSRDVTSALPSLAESWVWEKLAWMTSGVEYGTTAKSAPTGDVPVLRMGNIRDGRFDWSDLVYTSDYDEVARYRLNDGDVLFNRTNSPELVGKTAIYRGSRPAIFAGYLIRINNIRSIVDSQFLNLFLNSQVARNYGNDVKTDGVNQSNISGSKLMEYPFPFCSIEEQRETVRILANPLSIVDEMDREIATQLDRAAILRKAILRRAFSGQLVTQDPSEKPAFVLLGSIAAERKQARRSTTRPNVAEVTA